MKSLPVFVCNELYWCIKNKKGQIHTTTADNGKEFAAHQAIAKELDGGFFFARPYHSWKRGSNENLNGLIRQYI